MLTNINSSYLKQSMIVFTGVPMLIWALENAFERSMLKESLSVIFILAFCQMIGMFFLSRSNKYAIKTIKMGRMVKFHKGIGYICVLIMLFHPFLIVVPRFFESGVAPIDAFITIITTLNQGVVIGITAWSLMLVLGITALLRDQLPMRYSTWRIFHGIMAISFIFTASWHVIDLGRHASVTMSIFIILLATGGILLTSKDYIRNILKSSMFNRKLFP